MEQQPVLPHASLEVSESVIFFYPQTKWFCSVPLCKTPRLAGSSYILLCLPYGLSEDISCSFLCVVLSPFPIPHLMMKHSFSVRHRSTGAEEPANSILHCCNCCTLATVSSSSAVFGWEKALASSVCVCVLQSAMSRASAHPGVLRDLSLEPRGDAISRPITAVFMEPDVLSRVEQESFQEIRHK